MLDWLELLGVQREDNTKGDDAHSLEKAVIDKQQALYTPSKFIIDQEPLGDDGDDNDQHAHQRQSRRLGKLHRVSQACRDGQGDPLLQCLGRDSEAS